MTYRLRGAGGRRETVERVHGTHARHCPVYRSLEGAVEISTELTMEEG